jgi:hypothetical protein
MDESSNSTKISVVQLVVAIIAAIGMVGLFLYWVFADSCGCFYSKKCKKSLCG